MIFRSFAKSDFLKYFILLYLCSALLIFAGRVLLISDDLYFDAFGEQLAFEKIKELIEFNNKWSWVVYVVLPLIYLFKFLLVGLCLATGAFAFRLNVNMASFFRIVTLSEFIFLLPGFIKLIWFSFVDTSYTLQDLQQFAPLSILNFLNVQHLESWLVYPLGILNLFELAYLFSLSYWVAKELDIPLRRSVSLVLISYGTGIVVWVVFITFLTINLAL